MNLRELAPENVRAIAPYVPGKPVADVARELGMKEADIVKMASNENPMGTSPKALAAIRGALDGLAYYPDGNGFELKAVLARNLGVSAEHFILGNGSNDVLELVARAFLTTADSAVYSQHAFMVYPLAVQAMGAKHIVVPAKDFGHDLDAMRAAIRPDTKVVFLANPNNPTGTFIAWDTLRAFVERVAPTVLVVLDEAYGEYLASELRSPSIGWIAKHPNVIVSRTLSKAYGLAGLRVGFGVGHPDVIEVMNRVRQPFNVNQLALVAAAAAFEDHDFIEASRRNNREGMAQLEAGFRRLALEFIPSLGNFVAVRVGDAARIYDSLLQQGVIVRPVAGYGMPEHLRVTIGLPHENERFLAALERAIKGG
jgi:histidinol-phosphate aminotransferase